MRWLVIALMAALLAPAAARAELDVPALPWGNDFRCTPTAKHPRPVVLLHGLGGRAELNWTVMGPRLAAAGFCVFAPTYGIDPRTEGAPFRPGGTMPVEQSAPEIGAFVDRVLAATGATQVDLVGHSEGTVTPRFWLERLGGAAEVHTFVALAPLWRGTSVGGYAVLPAAGAPLSPPTVSPEAEFCGFCPQIRPGSALLTDLNRDGEAIPGVRHVNVVTRYDGIVVPYTSGLMRDGGKNIVLQALAPLDPSDHAQIPDDPLVVQIVLAALSG